MGNMATLDTIFDLFSKKRRRYALYYLDQQSGTVTVDEVVEYVANHENDATDETIPDEQYDRIELSLRQVHIPKTAEIDSIEYDRNEGEITIQGTPTEFDAIVTVAKVLEHAD
ncbi:hypothetical protein SAMN05421858_3013 [Haladaptatus litoreus]|uniref:DUF7344 domain-containing protein n=2 Tax=Haladaptatus litoreus TaxID=553468 RepID=A0A1N7CHP3_9EURY|nr:hypothetical protein SAMN05421858_3013 [Haladaptatus litoreus]